MRSIKLLATAATLALAALPLRTASAQVVVNATCNPVAAACDRIDFDFTALSPSEFFDVVIRTTDPAFTFRNDNTDPIGGGAFQNADIYDVVNDELFVWPGAIDPFGAGQQFSLFNFATPTQFTGKFILSLYFENAGALAPSTFAFETEYRDVAGNELQTAGNVGVTVGVVPEPGTVVLLASGLLGLGVAGLRRRGGRLAS